MASFRKEEGVRLFWLESSAGRVACPGRGAETSLWPRTGRLSSKERCEYHDTKLVHQGLAHVRTQWRSPSSNVMAQRPDGNRPLASTSSAASSRSTTAQWLASHWQCRRKPLGGIDNGDCQPGSTGLVIEDGRGPHLRGYASQSVPCWLFLPTVSVAGGGAGVEGGPVRRPEGPVVARRVQVQLQHAELR